MSARKKELEVLPVPEALPAEAPLAPPVAEGLGVRTKLMLGALAIMLLLALATTVISTETLRRTTRAEFQSRGQAIATSFAATAIETIQNRDASALQALVDTFAATEGVAYVVVYDPQKAVLAHTFAPFVPDGLYDLNVPKVDAPYQALEITVNDPQTKADRQILDIAVPIVAGQLGTIRVGMDLDVVASATRKATARIYGIVALMTILCLGGVFFLSGGLIRPILELAGLAQRVGRGDLSQLATVRTNDEIGTLAATMNDTITRLRGQLRTETELQDEKKQRDALQENIRQFLKVAGEIAKGDLSQRGRVTEDVLGNVVDAINVAIEEVGELIAKVQSGAITVNTGAQHLIAVTERMVEGARKQTGDVRDLTEGAEWLASSIREASGRMDEAAEKTRRTLEASQRGQASVVETLQGMQRIRNEVQAISRRIKTLGERSLEISEIVATMSDIASQTNLLAVNAAIEAAGAGEEGRRFAIVADQVRLLAEGSAKASTRIAGLVRRIQSEIQETQVAMEEGTREVEAGHQLATQAGQRLTEISEISGSTAQSVQLITAAMTKQVSGAERLTGGVQSIAAITATTEKAIVEGRLAADELLKLASELSTSAARFKFSR
jgi:methyl-accepting chemotaxis protein